jgi:hypothetical protein
MGWGEPFKARTESGLEVELVRVGYVDDFTGNESGVVAVVVLELPEGQRMPRYGDGVFMAAR